MKKVIFILLILLGSNIGCTVVDTELLELVLEIKNQNEELLEEVKSLQAKSDSLINELKNSAAKQEEVLKKVTDLQAELAKVISQIGKLSEQLNSQNADLNVIKSQLADLQEKYEGILVQLEQLQKLSQILAEIEKLKGQLSELDGKYQVILGSLAQNEEQFGALKGQIATLQAQLAENLTKISQLTSQLGEQGADIKKILSQIEELKASCAEIKSLLEDQLSGRSPVPTNGLVAWYPFNGNARDESENSNDGTVFLAKPTLDRFLNQNSAFDFNNNEGYIKTKNLIKTIKNNFSYSVWISTNVIEPVPVMGTNYISPFTSFKRQCVIHPSHGESFGDAALNSGSGLYAGKNVITVWEHSHLYVKAALVFQGTFEGWTNLVVVYKEKVPHLYVNGKFYKSGLPDPKRDVYPSLGNGGDYEFSGFGRGFFNDLFNGIIDDIALWDRILSEDEISKIYKGEGF